ncbi:Crp/Fnr family transcriptional regulator [Flavobacterium sp.]|uniref:Crp/Fnr family transcriptional regulator n=1 Tax=Flavobacterium sp. TaxID=239 RepID=UPI002B4B53CC|nr:Crp/Fnr family transcriptional regulator [Flavobacterium sp.]HLF52920.1 Crp/Fnr family transcriptional regulator [Flavobacterium sp.]
MVNNQYILPSSHTQLAVYLHGFETISARATQAIAEIATVLKIKRNQDLQSIGHTCKTIYFINKGIARIYYYHNGVDITESFIFENNIIARVESLFTGKPSRKAIQVLEDSEIVAIDATQLFDLYDTYPETERLFRKIFEAGYVDTVNRMEAIQFHTAEERYTLLIKEQPTLLQRVPLKHIASYLGITQVTLSRIRAVIR